MSGRGATVGEAFPIVDHSAASTSKPGYEEGAVLAAPMIPGATPVYRFKTDWVEPEKPIIKVVPDTVKESKGTFKKTPQEKRWESYLAANRARRTEKYDKGKPGLPQAIPVATIYPMDVMKPGDFQDGDETAEDIVEETVPGYVITPDMFPVGGKSFDMDDVLQEIDRRMGKRQMDDAPNVVVGVPVKPDAGPLQYDPKVQQQYQDARDADVRANWGQLHLGEGQPLGQSGFKQETGMPRMWSGPRPGRSYELRQFAALQQELEASRMANRELESARAQFANQEASMLESNRSAAAALKAKEAELVAAQTAASQLQGAGQQVTAESEAHRRNVEKLQRDLASLQDHHANTNLSYQQLQEQLHAQQQANLAKDKNYTGVMEELRQARAEAAADKLLAVDTTKIDGLKAQHDSMIKEANAHVAGLNKQIVDLNQKLASQTDEYNKSGRETSEAWKKANQDAIDAKNKEIADLEKALKDAKEAANREGNDITRDYMKYKEKAEDLQEEIARLRKEVDLQKGYVRADHTEIGDMIRQRDKERAEAAAQLKAASDGVAAKDAALREMEKQYRDAMANREKLSAAELLAIKGLNEAKLAEVIAASNGANEEMKRQIAVINAQLRQGGDEGGEQYNYTVNVLAELKALLVQSVEHHETNITNLQTNTVITEAAEGRFDELRAQIEEVMVTQKALVTKPQPSIEDIVEAVAGRIAADRAARILAEGADMPEKAGDMGSGAMAIVLVVVVSLVLYFFYRKKKKRH